jgi:hypothetical protein
MKYQESCVWHQDAPPAVVGYIHSLEFAEGCFADACGAAHYVHRRHGVKLRRPLAPAFLGEGSEKRGQEIADRIEALYAEASV